MDSDRQDNDDPRPCPRKDVHVLVLVPGNWLYYLLWQEEICSSLTLSLGEGNGNPPQYSCRLMRLSSSSSNPKPRTGKYAGCSAGPTIVNHEGPYKREHRRKWRYGHDQRLKRCALRAEEGASSQEMQATSGSWKGKETDSPPKAPERLQPCQHFDFRFHTSRIVRINLCFKSLSVVIC